MAGPTRAEPQACGRLPTAQRRARAEPHRRPATAGRERRSAAAAAAAGRAAQQQQQQQQEQQRAACLAPAEALDLLLAVRPGACPPGEARAPGSLCEEACPPAAGPAAAAAGAESGLRPALRVRNTFLDAPVQRSASLERFLEPRMCLSTPPTPQGRQGVRPQISTSLEDDPLPAYMINTPTESVREGLFASPRGESLSWPRPASPLLGLLRPARPPAAPAVLSLADAVGAPAGAPAPAAAGGGAAEAGAAALPSRGSALHRYGACKPCAFIYREGCRGGAECQFCHLCEPGERKARKKERLAAKRDAREEPTREQPSMRRGRAGGC